MFKEKLASILHIFSTTWKKKEHFTKIKNIC
jgi:hypothetical protein